MAHTQTAESPRAVKLERVPEGSALAGLVMLIIVAAIAALAIYRLAPPSPVPANAPAAEFSSGRAMKHLEAISRVTHPVGSRGHDEVRDYLLKELAALGASPEAMTATALDGGTPALVRAGTMKNVVARIAGTNNSKAVMLAAHYDSVPNSPGASDDGAGVAAILETVRAVRAGRALKNDLIVLFTDGEEVGSLGARAFVAEHPWAKDVGLVLNFEARGSGGPALMFETSQGNGRLIEEFAESAPHPVSNSLLYEIYRILPNDTDLTVFKGAKLPGLNFAYIEGVDHYHTSLDSIASLDERSLQHQGSYALALTRRAGGIDLADTRATDSVYFDVLGAAVVRYSKSWVWPLTALACLLFVTTALVGVRRRGLTPAGLVWGALAALAAVLVAYGCGALVAWAVGSARPSGFARSGLALAGLTVLAFAAASASYAFFGRRAGALSLLVGGLFWWVVPALALTALMPTASYLLTWPLLLALSGALLLLVLRRPETSLGATGALVFAACGVAAVILFAPAIYISFVGLSLSAAAALAAVAALLVTLFLPSLGLSTSPRRWLLPAAALCAGVVLILGGFFAARSGRQPRPDSLFYGLNADGGTAAWGSADPRPDEWTSQFLSSDARRDRMADFFPFGSRDFLTKPASPVALEAPRAEVLSDQTSGDVRSLKLRITSPRSAPIVSVYFDEASGAARPSVNGRALEADAPALGGGGKRWVLRYYALPPEGAEVAVDVKAGKPLQVRLVDQSYGLPAGLTSGARPRPEGLIALPLPYNDSTMVSKVYTF
jgi:Peptidase family M28